jgi:mRNA-degrading endonuclease YafQ of YafQ-DinJ toxin-antitoxin module
MNTEEEINEFFSKFGIKQKEISSAVKKGSQDTEPSIRTLTLFRRKLSKLKKNRDFRIELLKCVVMVMKNPYVGVRKKGNLKGLRVLEMDYFKNGRLVYSYIKESNTIHFIAVGSHADIGSKYEVIKNNLGDKLRYYNKRGE